MLHADVSNLPAFCPYPPKPLLSMYLFKCLFNAVVVSPSITSIHLPPCVKKFAHVPFKCFSLILNLCPLVLDFLTLKKMKLTNSVLMKNLQCRTLDRF